MGRSADFINFLMKFLVKENRDRMSDEAFKKFLESEAKNPHLDLRDM